MSDTPRTDAEDPDLINLMEWNRFAEQGMTLLEVLTILNNRHRAEIKAMMVAETHAMRELNVALAAKQELQEAVTRMEAVPVQELDKIWDDAPGGSALVGFEAVRARLIQAAKGES